MIIADFVKNKKEKNRKYLQFLSPADRVIAPKSE